MTAALPQSITNAPLIFGALARAMAKIGAGGISKDRRNKDQGFNFRGIDDVYNALNPIFSEEQIIPVPQYTERVVDVRLTAAGKNMYNVTVRGTIRFYAADGSYVEATTYGEAQDTADKATNKAESAAYKYACFQVLCIPTEETAADADGDPKVETAPQPKPLTEQQLAELRGQLTALGIKEDLFCNSVKIKSLDEIVDTDLPGLQKLLDKKRDAKAKAKAEAAQSEKAGA